MTLISTAPATAPVTEAGRRRRPVTYWAYLVPIGIGFGAIVLVPFAMNLYYSFFDWKGGAAPRTWVGLDNYRELLRDDVFWSSFGNTLYLIVAIAVVPTLIGLLLAALLFDYLGRLFGPRVASVLRASYYLPQILPIAVAGVVWAWILETRDGALNSTLRALGIAGGPDWLGDPDIALRSVMIMLIWLQIGYPVVIFMSALQRVEPELHEAAELDGAGWWRRFRAITVPHIRTDIYVVVLTATIGAMKLFAPILILTKGGPESSTYVPSYFSYRNFFELSRVGYGAASATTLAIVIGLVAAGLIFWQARSMEER
ncbi:carbohydrate ABC transporter permease [Jiangella anatolica]|uniref:Sugar ABC transporter permease n=1 Tax=Jiangella anatolica TaxID=2670374 RepID=A0A2W2BGG3_9ACTN|nr:sugar ABC transporter permease [Jiangella anatolica]PZF86285.1 sugar ABC transporter permease [Jiangella anatolica]